MAQKNLSIKLSLNDRQFQSNLRKATRAMKKFGSSMKRTGQTLSRNLTLPLVAFGAASIAAFDKQQKAIAQVEAGIKSTGGAAGFTSKQLQKMASELQGKTLFGDEDILQNATAQLLTFTNIAGEQFARTQVAVTNLATKSFRGDLKSASIQLGKALNDPIANLSALSRAGIQFSDEQKEVIKTLVETNRLAEAQNLILDELETQFGGSAEAAAQAGAGGLKQLQNQFGDLMEEIGGMLIPIVIDLGNQFKSFLEGFAKLDPEVKKLIITVGILAGALGPLLVLLGSLVTIIAGLSIKLIAITAALAAVGLLIIYIADNIEQLKDTEYSLSFFFNSLIMGLQKTLRGLGLFVEGYNAFLDLIGLGDVEFLRASNELAKLADNLDPALLETGQYESKFDSFTEFMDRQGIRLKNIMRDIADALNLGDPSGVTSTPKSGTAPVTDAPIQNNPLQNILDSVNFLNEEESLIKAPLYKEGFSTEVDEFTDLMGNISTIQEQLSQSFMSFGNVLQGTFAQALQSSDGFFKSFVEGSKRAMSALMAQLAATLALNALLGGSKLGGMIGLKDIGGLGGIGTALKGLFMADGGLATGATLAMVGEGPGTSMANPEVIAPLDKLKSMIGDNGSGAVEVFGTISGQDILLSSDRARNNRTRTRGY
jgi:hypothetical protein